MIPEGTVLTQRHLNRSLLARQHLLGRVPMLAGEMITHLVGMQSQVPADPYIGLWARIDGFRTDDLSRMMLDRAAVRASLMRGTIHLVTSGDYFTLQPVMRALHERVFPATDSGRHLDTEVLPEILSFGACLLSERPMTVRELGERLAERWPDRHRTGMAQAIRFLTPLVQVTPRGVWGESHQATWALASEWLGRPVPENADPGRIVMRYLRAFGPATIADIQAWSGLQGQRRVVDGIRSQLRTFRNERGQELFDVPDGVMVDQETPAPVRFLPGFENALLSHKDRTRIISEERRKAIGSRNGLFQSTYLVDGFVAGTWATETAKDRATLVIRPFERHAPAVIRELQIEGEQLAVLVTGQPPFDIRIEDQ